MDKNNTSAKFISYRKAPIIEWGKAGEKDLVALLAAIDEEQKERKRIYSSTEPQLDSRLGKETKKPTTYEELDKYLEESEQVFHYVMKNLEDLKKQESAYSVTGPANVFSFGAATPSPVCFKSQRKISVRKTRRTTYSRYEFDKNDRLIRITNYSDFPEISTVVYCFEKEGIRYGAMIDHNMNWTENAFAFADIIQNGIPICSWFRQYSEVYVFFYDQVDMESRKCKVTEYKYSPRKNCEYDGTPVSRDNPFGKKGSVAVVRVYDYELPDFDLTRYKR